MAAAHRACGGVERSTASIDWPASDSTRVRPVAASALDRDATVLHFDHDFDRGRPKMDDSGAFTPRNMRDMSA